MYMIYDQLVQDYGAVTYEAFINLLVRAMLFSRDEVCSLSLTPAGRDYRGPDVPGSTTRVFPWNCARQGTGSSCYHL